jgi:hypothetical protein
LSCFCYVFSKSAQKKKKKITLARTYFLFLHTIGAKGSDVMPYSGTLTARVYTGRGEIPVEDASVSIVQRGQGGKRTLLSVQRSDQSGGVAPVTIPTPSPQTSQSPGAEAPFALCDIWAEHPDYQMLVIHSAQIFPGVVSFQALPLIPLPETGEPSGEIVDIPAQDL